MAITSDQARCGEGENGGVGLLASPFYAPRYHFGMLLGVDDFDTEQAYHRGKMRLHNAWLHREGVVWGYDVRVPEVTGRPGVLLGEVQVEPGLALDAAGHELHLDARACLSLAAWYEAHRDDEGLEVRGTDAEVVFDAHVVIRFRACLSRQVPALLEPCAGASSETAYSRTSETVEILLRPGLSPARPYPYHRLRVLFGLEAAASPADDDVRDARTAVLAKAPAEQPAAYLEAFRRFAALDEIDLQPFVRPDGTGSTLFPGEEDAPVVLADLRDVTLTEQDGRLTLTSAKVETAVRPSHVATSTIQELLCGPLFGAAAAPAPAPADGPAPVSPAADAPAGEAAAAPPDAGGPRVDPASVVLKGETITFQVSSPLSAASVEASSFVVAAYDRRDGWSTVDVKGASVKDDRVTVDLTTAPGGNLVRLIARGTGDSPLLGTNLVPLAGAVGGPLPGTAHDGHDFVFMLKRR